MLVLAADHRLHLCAGGRSWRDFRVALGKGGLGKRREGDGRTPRGDYPLAPPRRSRRFGTFIAILYPTPAERAAGATGGGVGIHGPLRALRFAGALNVIADWTDGCVAIASDAEMAEIATWVRRKRVRRVRIE